VRLGLLALVAVLVQIAALSQLSLFGANPDVSPLIVASAGLLVGSVGGALTGFAIGLLVDFALLQTLGVSSLVLSVVGYGAGRVRETARDPLAAFLPLGVGALATLGAMVGFSLLQFLLGVEAPVSLELVRQIVSTVLVNTLIALPVHAIVRRALGPAAPQLRRRRSSTPGISPLINA
jgi:rod shape-determining protein MreD